MAKSSTTIAFRFSSGTLVYPIAGDEVFEKQLREVTQVRVRVEQPEGNYTEIVMNIGEITIVRGEQADPDAPTVPISIDTRKPVGEN